MSTKVIKNQYVFTEEMDNDKLLKGNDILIISDNPFEEMNGKLKRYIDDLVYNIRKNYYNEDEVKETIYVAFREEKENGIGEYKIKIKIPVNIDKTVDEYVLPNCDAPINIYNNELHILPVEIIIFFDILDIDKNDFNIILCNFQRVKDKVIYFISENIKRTKDKETRSIVKNIKNIKNTRRRIDVLIKDDDGRITDIETKGYALYKIG